MKKVLIVLIIFIEIILCISVTNKVYAADGLGEVISGGKDFMSSSSNEFSVSEDSLKNTSTSLYNILLMLSFIVVACIGVYLGIKYMWAGVDEKAEVKDALVVFTVGCIVTYGAFGIWKVIAGFLQSNF
ncbi:MAG: hypothetical protein HFJ59_07740 [Clostridia bacterium]|nr:hypothetical protein [Clostridia bacterium]